MHNSMRKKTEILQIGFTNRLINTKYKSQLKHKVKILGTYFKVRNRCTTEDNLEKATRTLTNDKKLYFMNLLTKILVINSIILS